LKKIWKVNNKRIWYSLSVLFYKYYDLIVSMKNRIILILILVINMLVLGGKNCALAQQTIIYLPTPEVLKPGKFAIAGRDIFRPYKKGEYNIIGPKLIFGIPHAEIQMSPLAVITNGDTQPRMDLGIKSTINITKTTTFTGMYKTFIDLDKQITPFNLGYLTFAQRVPKINTRLTAGIYLANQKDYLPNKVGAALACEWSIKPKKVDLIIEWQSGHEFYNFVGSGVRYFFSPTLIASVGTLAPNSRHSKFAFIVGFIKYVN
jgi:hypothetical protein